MPRRRKPDRELERITPALWERDRGCVGPKVKMPGDCLGAAQRDHVRASGGLGMKSRSRLDNVVLLCGLSHHPLKTREARTWRPALLAYLSKVEPSAEGYQGVSPAFLSAEMALHGPGGKQ